jgi:hypothetical protein
MNGVLQFRQNGDLTVANVISGSGRPRVPSACDSASSTREGEMGASETQEKAQPQWEKVWGAAVAASMRAELPIRRQVST